MRGFILIVEVVIMKKIIELRHHVHDYECMWNGIEDIYINKTNETLPANFFFLLSGSNSFCYMNTSKADLKRLIALGDGRTKNMYAFLAPIVGFEYKHYTYKKFESALSKAIKEINVGYPVVLGALDMYYLPYYPKIFHQYHIPFHYVLMVGYDDEKQEIYLYDCGKKELLSMSYQDLKSSMNCSYPGLSKENTICTIRMNEVRSKYQIALDALKIKAQLFLEPPTPFLGHKGFMKFINDLPTIKNEVGKNEYDKILKNLVMFFGTGPTLPNALLGINSPDKMVFKGGFDKISMMLNEIGNEYHNTNFLQAIPYFDQCAIVIENITHIIVQYLLDIEDKTYDLAMLFLQVKNNMETANRILKAI